MKYQFNLLPDEYIVIKKNNKFIYVFFLVLIMILLFFIKNTLRNRTTLIEINKVITLKSEYLKNIYSSMDSQKVDENAITDLKKEIEFVNKNLETASTDVVIFLNRLEDILSENIIVKDIIPKKLDDLSVPFVLECESLTEEDISSFIAKLNESNKFVAELKSNKSVSNFNDNTQNFVLEIKYIQ